MNPVEFHGQTFEPGQGVCLIYPSANRDDREFQNPDTFDIHREIPRILSFGQGIHVCVGAPLARLEAQETFAALTERFDVPTIVDEQYEYWPTVIGRSLKSLHVRF